MDLSLRVKREQESYDDQSMVLGQVKLQNILAHANLGPSRIRRDQTIAKQVQRFIEADTLEIGSKAWTAVFGRDKMQPRNLTCINISQVELDIGINSAKEVDFNAQFKLMDAHQLDFPDESFDLVYGVAILHHLEFKKAMEEIWRVLRPGGEIMFVEPLRLNPIAQLVRLITPNARTKDELPLGKPELALIERYFECDHHYSDLFSVPIAVLSRFIFKNPVNPLTKAANTFDQSLLALFPSVGPLFRSVTLMGRKRKTLPA